MAKDFIKKVTSDLQNEEFTEKETARFLAHLIKHNLIMFDCMIHLANFILSTRRESGDERTAELFLSDFPKEENVEWFN